MELDQIKTALDEALRLRSPTFGPDEPRPRRIEALEDYMLRSAHVNGNLVEARHWLRLLRDRLADEWDKLVGWEAATSKARGRLTAADVERAKTTVAPGLYSARGQAKMLAESVDDQIARLEREERVCSRAYTMETGG